MLISASCTQFRVFFVFYVFFFHVNVFNFRFDYSALTGDKLMTICPVSPPKHVTLFIMHIKTTLS